jgi:DNA-binding NarL/FixJ family response regulator
MDTDRDTAEAKRILIADDHPAMRRMARYILEEHGFEVCAEVGNATAAIEAAIRERPDICLLDIHMPGNGIRATREIRQQLPDAAIVMLTVSREDSDLFDALMAGASGYLLKDMNPDRLPAALQGVLDGEAALPRQLVGRLVEEFRTREGKRRLPVFKQRRASLTSREWEVLQFLREGLSTAQIAKRLFVAPVTVRTHVSSALKKLQVPDREAAVRLMDEE